MGAVDVFWGILDENSTISIRSAFRQGRAPSELLDLDLVVSIIPAFKWGGLCSLFLLAAGLESSSLHLVDRWTLDLDPVAAVDPALLAGTQGHNSLLRDRWM